MYCNRLCRIASRLQTCSQYLDTFKKIKSVSKILVKFSHKSLKHTTPGITSTSPCFILTAAGGEYPGIFMRTEQQVLMFSIHCSCIFIRYFLYCNYEMRIIYRMYGMSVQRRSLRYSVFLVSLSMYIT